MRIGYSEQQRYFRFHYPELFASKDKTELKLIHRGVELQGTASFEFCPGLVCHKDNGRHSAFVRYFHPRTVFLEGLLYRTLEGYDSCGVSVHDHKEWHGVLTSMRRHERKHLPWEFIEEFEWFIRRSLTRYGCVTFMGI